MAAASSPAAYRYVHYSSAANLTPIYEKFNLANLPNNTVTFSVQDQGPSTFAANDSFGSVLAQIRGALAAWNSVAVSDLRVSFGGLESYTANPAPATPGAGVPGSNTPAGDIIFVDTPGLLGLGAPTISTVQVQGPDGPFYPIVRGLVMLSRDTSNPNGTGPSYTEEYFTTAVHEIGHALGLQHTWTASAMSQDVIRNTSRARALDADDIASLAVLYGKHDAQGNPVWRANYGSISGRVTFAGSGAGVVLASVVAISPNGPAVSALTNPDGTYRIDGLPPGFSYLVYAHPLPPDAAPADNSGIRLPMIGTDPTQSFAPNGSFTTVFNTGAGVTLDPNAAAAYVIAPATSTASATTVANVNFSVQPRAGVPAYDVLTYSRINTASRLYTWPGDATVLGYPAFIQTSVGAGLVIAQASSPAVLAIPQSVTMLGGFAPAPLNLGCSSLPAVCPYPDQPAVAIYFTVPPGSAIGPRHLVFNFGNDIYVMPSSVDMVQKGPPVINSVTPNGDGTVTVTGAGLGPDSRVFFDGMQASLGIFAGTDTQGSIVVTPPQAASGQTAAVTVFNSDGQNSTILQSSNPPTFAYPVAAVAPLLAAIAPQSMAAGASAAIDITAFNTNFVDGQVSVGFGSADVQVRRVWVQSPTHLVVDAVAAPNAAASLSEVSVVSGMQVIAQSGAFQTLPAPAAGTPQVLLPIINVMPGQAGIYPGSFASVYGANLGASGSSVQVVLNGQPVPSYVTPFQINFLVPQTAATGPATLSLSGLAAAPAPVWIQIDKPAPGIVSVNTAAGAPAASSTLLAPGDTLHVFSNGLDPAVVAGFQGRLRVTVAGMDMPVRQVAPLGAGLFDIQVVLNQSFGSSQVPLAVIADGSASAAATITVK